MPLSFPGSLDMLNNVKNNGVFLVWVNPIEEIQHLKQPIVDAKHDGFASVIFTLEDGTQILAFFNFPNQKKSPTNLLFDFVIKYNEKFPK